MKKFELPRTKQCKNCPWKESVNPADIPNGFDYDSHHRLLDSQPAEGQIYSDKIHLMACHNSNDKDEMFCIGWLSNQLGAGNNIPLRIKMMGCTNVKDIETFGRQRRNFKDVKPIQK